MYPQTFYGKMRVSLFRQEVRPVICCISDIHGELDKLEQMLELIRFSGEDHLYILGGVIVRGTLGGDIFWRIIAATNMTMLLGNHKQMCLRTLEPNNEFGARDLWRMNGGFGRTAEGPPTGSYSTTARTRRETASCVFPLNYQMIWNLWWVIRNFIWSTVSQVVITIPASGAGWSQTTEAPFRTPSALSATRPRCSLRTGTTRTFQSGMETASSTSTAAVAA